MALTSHSYGLCSTALTLRIRKNLNSSMAGKLTCSVRISFFMVETLMIADLLAVMHKGMRLQSHQDLHLIELITSKFQFTADLLP